MQLRLEQLPVRVRRVQSEPPGTSEHDTRMAENLVGERGFEPPGTACTSHGATQFVTRSSPALISAHENIPMRRSTAGHCSYLLTSLHFSTRPLVTRSSTPALSLSTLRIFQCGAPRQLPSAAALMLLTSLHQCHQPLGREADHLAKQIATSRTKDPSRRSLARKASCSPFRSLRNFLMNGPSFNCPTISAPVVRRVFDFAELFDQGVEIRGLCIQHPGGQHFSVIAFQAVQIVVVWNKPELAN